MGILCSMHMMDAVRSTTASCLSITSWMEISSYFFASGFDLGIAVINAVNGLGQKNARPPPSQWPAAVMVVSVEK